MIRRFERPRCGTIVTLMSVFLASLATQQAARGQLISVGSSYNVGGTNFVTTYGPQAVTLDQTTKLVDGGLLRLTETITPTSADSGEWLVFSFRSVSGGPLAGNQNSTLDWYFSHLLTNQPALIDDVFYDWSFNGTAVNPIFPFGGINQVAPNPIDPSLGPAYVFPSSPGFGPLTQFDSASTTFVSPYSFVASGGINPNTANGFDWGAFHSLLRSRAPWPWSVSGVWACSGSMWRRRYVASPKTSNLV